jgi:long-subunit fatty acid transport protein
MPRRSRRALGWAWSLGLAAALGPAGAAWASAGDTYGYGARAGGLSGAMTALADDHAALFYNPAGMSLGAPTMAVGLLTTFDEVQIRRKRRPAGYDLPDLGTSSPAIPSNARLGAPGDVDDIPNLYSLLVGATGSFGLSRLRVGVSVLLPLNQLGHQRTTFPDEREQYYSNRLSWTLLGERSEHQTILVGGSWMLLDWLAVGFGVSVLPSAETASRVYLADALRQDEVEMAVDNHQTASTGLQVGVLARPTAALRLGASYRTENAFAMRIRNEVQVKGFQGDPSSFPLIQDVTMVVNYQPAQASFGAAWQGARWTASADAVWARWSRALDHQGLRSGALRDTVAARLGAELRDNPSRTLRLGVGWEPTPVPAQTGRTNYVDNDRLRFALGGSHVIELLGEAGVEVVWYAQAQVLLARDTDKARLASHPVCAPGVDQLCDEIADDTPNPLTGAPEPAFAGLQTGSPGFPGWVSYGSLLAVGLELRWSF